MYTPHPIQIQSKKMHLYASNTISTPQGISPHYSLPALSAHSLVPICTNLEHALANAKTSSSPENNELVPTLCVMPRSSITLRWWSLRDWDMLSSEKTWVIGTEEVVNSLT